MFPLYTVATPIFLLSCVKTVSVSPTDVIYPKPKLKNPNVIQIKDGFGFFSLYKCRISFRLTIYCIIRNTQQASHVAGSTQHAPA